MSLCACTFVFAVLRSRFWDLGGSGLAPNLHLTLHPHTQGKGLSILWRRRPLGSHLHEKRASCLAWGWRGFGFAVLRFWF